MKKCEGKGSAQRADMPHVLGADMYILIQNPVLLKTYTRQIQILCNLLSYLLFGSQPYYAPTGRELPRCHAQRTRGRSAARSPWQVPLLCARILDVSSKPVQIVQRGFGVRFICA
jgi:hypothetical protein